MRLLHTNAKPSNMGPKSRLGCAIVLAVLVFAAPSASGCISAGPVPLKALARSSDLVIKATAIADQPVNDPSFERFSGFEVRETELRVLSIVKGTASNVIKFRHYAPILGKSVWMMCPPPSYTFVVGRTYIVLATRGAGDTYEQLSKSPGTWAWDPSVLPAADAKALQTGDSVTDAVWGALVTQLKSPDPTVVLKAIGLLDEMSGGWALSARDFNRSQVLAAIQPLIGAKNVAIATAAIKVFARESLYTDDWSAPQWLAGIGKGTFPGIVPFNTSAAPLSDSAAKLLLRVATSEESGKVRALAITALARSHAIPRATIAEWFRDPSMAVRKAAVLASAATLDRMTIEAATTDASPEIRQVAALAIGLTQNQRLLPLLGSLLEDSAADVRAAAAMSLVSFGPDQAAQLMRANFGSEFGPLFVNALARGNPQPYLPLLAKIIREQPQPADWWGGTLPAADSWKILFDYIKSCPSDEFTHGELNRWFDALQQSPAQPTDLYALYLSHGLVTRAKQFRTAMRKSPGYLDNVYNTIKRDPAAYIQ